MNLLAIETSVACASLCLYKENRIAFSTRWEAERNHDAHLFPALSQALELLGENSILDYILVGAGPGSYGGVRVALTAGVGIATVTGAKLVAIESWAQLAEKNACVIADARRGGWTVRFPDSSIGVLAPEEISRLDYPLYSTEKPGAAQASGISNIHKEGLVPTAEGIVSTWLALNGEEQQKLLAKPAEPIYVRPPHITASTRKPWEI